jgi:hypothetical protein
MSGGLLDIQNSWLSTPNSRNSSHLRNRGRITWAIRKRNDTCCAAFFGRPHGSARALLDGLGANFPAGERYRSPGQATASPSESERRPGLAGPWVSSAEQTAQISHGGMPRPNRSAGLMRPRPAALRFNAVCSAGATPAQAVDRCFAGNALAGEVGFPSAHCKRPQAPKLFVRQF